MGVLRSHGGSQGASQLEHFLLVWEEGGKKAADEAVRRQVFTTIVKMGTGM
jgi:hypothetical protein